MNYRSGRAAATMGAPGEGAGRAGLGTRIELVREGMERVLRGAGEELDTWQSSA